MKILKCLYAIIIALCIVSANFWAQDITFKNDSNIELHVIEEGTTDDRVFTDQWGSLKEMGIPPHSSRIFTTFDNSKKQYRRTRLQVSTKGFKKVSVTPKISSFSANKPNVYKDSYTIWTTESKNMELVGSGSQTRWADVVHKNIGVS